MTVLHVPLFGSDFSFLRGRLHRAAVGAAYFILPPSSIPARAGSAGWFSLVDFQAARDELTDPVLSGGSQASL